MTTDSIRIQCVLLLLFSGYSTKGLEHNKWPEKIFKLRVTVSALSVALLTDIVKLGEFDPKKETNCKLVGTFAWYLCKDIRNWCVISHQLDKSRSHSFEINIYVIRMKKHVAQRR